jgi:hypothetical protein
MAKNRLKTANILAGKAFWAFLKKVFSRLNFVLRAVLNTPD